MSYIGTIPKDTFTTGLVDRFTSTTGTTVTLTHEISAKNDIIVFVNFVKQDSTNYSVGGTGNKTLTLGGTLVSSDIVEVHYLNKVFGTQQPSANSVGITELNLSEGTSGQALTTNGSGTLSFATIESGSNTPNFDVRLSSNFGLTNDTFTKVTWSSETFDSDNAFASNKFTVPSGKGGKYVFIAHYKIGNSLGYYTFKYYKNGSAVSIDGGGVNRNIYNYANSDNDFSFHHIVMLNLSAGDYIETYAQTTSGSGNNVYANQSYFQGFKLI